MTVPKSSERLNFGMMAVRYEDSSWQCLTQQSPPIHCTPLSCSVPAGEPVASCHRLLQHFCHVVFWSLESIPEIISAGNTSTHLFFWWQKHQTMAFVQGSGTATLSLTSSLKTPQGHLIKADDRDSKKRRKYIQCTKGAGQSVLKCVVSSSRHVFFPPARL